MRNKHAKNTFSRRLPILTPEKNRFCSYLFWHFFTMFRCRKQAEQSKKQQLQKEKKLQNLNNMQTFPILKKLFSNFIQNQFVKFFYCKVLIFECFRSHCNMHFWSNYSRNRLMWSLWARPKVNDNNDQWFLLSNLK